MRLSPDDVRQSPPGWTLVRTPPEIFRLMEKETVDEISLAHDLGPSEARDGSTVLAWIEEQVSMKYEPFAFVGLFVRSVMALVTRSENELPPPPSDVGLR